MFMGKDYQMKKLEITDSLYISRGSLMVWPQTIVWPTASQGEAVGSSFLDLWVF